MPPPVEKKMNLGLSARGSTACSRFREPIKLTWASRVGSLADTATLAWAARWNTAFGVMPATILPRESSRTSASINSADGWRLPASPVSSVSMTWTRWPASTSRSTRWLPMKPAPPVTRTSPGEESSRFMSLAWDWSSCTGGPRGLILTRQLVPSQGRG